MPDIRDPRLTTQVMSGQAVEVAKRLDNYLSVIRPGFAVIRSREVVIDNVVDFRGHEMVAYGLPSYQTEKGMRNENPEGNISRLAFSVIPTIDLTLEENLAWRDESQGVDAANIRIFIDHMNASAILGSLFTVGSVIFINAAGDFAEDNANFFWDDAANNLRLGNNLLVGGSTVRLSTGIGIENTSPSLYFFETDASGGEKFWTVQAGGGAFVFGTRSDDGFSISSWLRANRTGIVVDEVILGPLGGLKVGILKTPLVELDVAGHIHEFGRDPIRYALMGTP